MNKRVLQILISAAAVTALMVAALVQVESGANTQKAQAKASTYSKLSPLQKRLLSGFADNTLDPLNGSNPSRGLRNYSPDTGDDQCAVNLGSNTKVNQNCLNLSDADLQGRAQANNETSIAVDPNNPNNLVASANDYRRGDGNCYGAYTLDAGSHWNDSTVPMSFTRGTAFGTARQYWQAGGDTSVAWDTKGNVYFDCQVFQRGFPTTPNPDTSSAVYVFRSTHNKGASWNFPGRPVVEFANLTGSPTASVILEDKPLMTVDNHKGSPYQDRVYVTYTEFALDGTAYIYESYSKDYGETFSPRVLVSKNSPLCKNNFGITNPNGNCNANQFSQPFTGPDGNLYVVYANFNNAVGKPAGDGGNGGNANVKSPAANPNENYNQMLLSKSTDGGRTFSAPVLAGRYYDLPDCATYQNGQDAGRACVPEKGKNTNSVFRATNYPSGAVNPNNAKQVVVTFGSYINTHSNESNGCAPAGFSTLGLNLYTGVKTPGACNNDILVSVFGNAGTSFTGTTTDPRKLPSANPNSGATDQWWQWTSFSNSGKLAISYYDRKYGNDEFSGNMDVSLSGSEGSFTGFNTVRVTSSSMPLPTQFPDVQGNSVFFGDYTGLTVANNTAYPVWMDTRSKDLVLCPGTGVTGVPPQVCRFSEPSGIQANDQDIFVAGVALP
ncbi:MAG: glycoside hydrolase [Chloroflexota bacterium]|nr:glycoside hydrolase [Chloroflexota bacterium]